MSMTICPEDLLVVARRRPLSADEQRQLDEHAAGCPLCRMAIAISARLDPLPAIDDDRTNDEVLAARLVARTLAPQSAGTALGPASAPAEPAARGRATPADRSSVRAPRRDRALARRGPRWAVAAVVVLMAGSASAALWQLSSWRLPWSFARRPATTGAGERGASARAEARAPAARPVERRWGAGELARELTRACAGDCAGAPAVINWVPAPSAAPPRSGAVRAVLAKATPSPSPATPSQPAPAGRPPTTAPAAVVPRPAMADASAPALFRAANQARRAGELAEARRLYRALQSGYPGCRGGDAVVPVAGRSACPRRIRRRAGTVRRLPAQRRRRARRRSAGRPRAHAGPPGPDRRRARDLAAPDREPSAVGLSMARAAAPRRAVRDRRDPRVRYPPAARATRQG